jgi:two-component system nitrate/nitrite response regulator NarP
MTISGDASNTFGKSEGCDNAVKPLSILIADDHVLLAESVAAALSAPPRYFQTKIVSSFEETIAALTSGPNFDLVMLDLRMPGMLGLKSVNRVIEIASPTWVVLLSGNADRGVVQSAVNNGARGLIPKTLSLKAMISVVQVILSGQIFIPAADSRSISDTGGSDTGQLHEREVTILQLASEGRTNKEIASAIDATEVTIKMHMRSICRKLNARNRAHAVVISKERDLL